MPFIFIHTDKSRIDRSGHVFKRGLLWLCFCSKSYQIILKFSAKFCCTYTLPQLQASKEQKMHGSKVKFICTLISMPLKPSMETPIDLIAFEHYFGHFLKLSISPPFTTCNSQLQEMTAPPPALLSFAHF